MYGTTFFPKPEGLFTEAARVMSLRSPTDKMSKSDRSESSRINLTGEERRVGLDVITCAFDTHI